MVPLILGKFPYMGISEQATWEGCRIAEMTTENGNGICDVMRRQWGFLGEQDLRVWRLGFAVWGSGFEALPPYFTILSLTFGFQV